MDKTIHPRRQADLALVERPPLFIVFIDLNARGGPPDWQMNSCPKPLFPALIEAQELRRREWRTKLEPET
jgi:hypothetical protein